MLVPRLFGTVSLSPFFAPWPVPALGSCWSLWRKAAYPWSRFTLSFHSYRKCLRWLPVMQRQIGLSRALCQLHCHAPFNSHPCAKQANGWRSRKASGTLTSQSDSLAHGDSGGCGWDNWFCFRKILEYASALSRPLTVRSGHDKAFQKGPFANGNRDRMP
jgi:hypothetical protein